jgi:hypothetical protein
MDRFDTQDHQIDIIAHAISQSAESFPADRRAAVRRRVIAHVMRDVALVRGRVVFQRAMATITVAATLLGGVSYAAAVSLPGNPLYEVKRVAEDVTLQVLPDGALQQAFLFTIATRRADELSRMTDHGADEALMSRTLEQFQATTSAAYRAGTTVGETDSGAETRLRERVNAASQPAKTQLQEALEAANSPVPAQPPVNADPQEPTGGVGNSTGGSGSGTPSGDATGPAGSGRP